MQTNTPSITNSEKLRRANAKFVEHYAQWASHMLTLTFKSSKNCVALSQSQTDRLLNHLRVDLNYNVWKKRSKYNVKANILYIPIVEGSTDNKQMHLHILVGNIKDVQQLHTFIEMYIRRWTFLGFKYDIREIYSVDGLCWYLTKETQRINTEAVRWESALIPASLIPKQHTLLYA